MRALVHHANATWALAGRPTPQGLGPNEVMVHIRAAGICGTDLGILQGDYPATPGVILGHEAAGEVVAFGEAVRGLAPAQRVAIDPTFFCSQCRMCRTGRPNHCMRKHGTETGVSRDGCFAEYYVTEERFLYPLADHVSFAAASFAEPLSCVLTGLNHLRLRPGLRTAVLGGGPIGALYAAALALRGLAGEIVEASPRRREVLDMLALPGWRTRASLADDGSGELDIAVETTGKLAQQALSRMARGGQLLLVGLKPSRLVVDPGELADRSLSLIGSIDTIGTFPDSLALITAGRIPVEALVTHTLELEDWSSALQLLGLTPAPGTARQAPAAMKVILRP